MAVTVLKFAGLWTSSNSLGSVPSGALQVADNCVIRYQDVIESRRGQFLINSLQDPGLGVFGSLSSRSTQGFEYLSVPHVVYDAGILSRYDATTGLWHDYSGTYAPPTNSLGMRTRFVEAQQDLFFTSSSGVQAVDSLTGAVTSAGVKRALDLNTTDYIAPLLTEDPDINAHPNNGFYAIDSAGAAALGLSGGPWLGANQKVGYVATWYRRDASNRLIEGAPSGRTLFSQAGGTTTIAAGSNGAALPQATINVASTSGFAAAGRLALFLQDGTTQTVTYTGVTATTFTGCTGGAGTMHTADAVDTPLVYLLGTVPVPKGLIGTAATCRVYRTPTSAVATPPLDPGDNYYLQSEIPLPAVTSWTATPSNTGAGLAFGSYFITTITLPAHGLTTGALVNFSAGGATTPIPDTNGPYFVYAPTANLIVLRAYNTNALPSNQTMTLVAVGMSDYTPDSMLGQPLYTNPLDGDGSLLGASDNAEPPLAMDVELWNNSVWYANCTNKHRLQMELLGISTGTTSQPDGLTVGDNITIDSVSYTAVSTLSTGTTKQFVVTPSNATTIGPSQAIELTAKALCAAINTTSSRLIAYYVSGVNTAPGLIQIEESGVGGASFSVYVNRPAAWAPNVGTGPGSAVTSTNDAAPNRLYKSKPYQPEAVPLINYIEVGSKYKNILRILRLRQNLYVFKEDGIYIVSQAETVQDLDTTAHLIAPESACRFANQIYALTNQGVVTVSELGVQVVSQPIEDQILPLFSTGALPVLRAASFAAPYESERTYLLGLPASSSSTSATQVFAYNYITKAWTRWPVARSWGHVLSGSDTLYMGDPAINTLRQERKSYTNMDNADDCFRLTISSHTSSTVTLSSVAGVAVGDVLAQGAIFSVITAVNSGTNVVTVYNTGEAWSAATALIYKAIPCELQWQLNLSAPPNFSKQWSQGALHFRRFATVLSQVEVATEFDPVPSVSVLSGGPGWGAAVWGTTPQVTPSTLGGDLYTLWGTPAGPKNERFLIAQGKQRSTYLTLGFKVTEALSDWALLGASLIPDEVSERTTR